MQFICIFGEFTLYLRNKGTLNKETPIQRTENRVQINFTYKKFKISLFTTRGLFVHPRIHVLYIEMINNKKKLVESIYSYMSGYSRC
jgi:hypothetical protein